VDERLALDGDGLLLRRRRPGRRVGHVRRHLVADPVDDRAADRLEL